MRVALVNNFFPPRVSGSAHFTQELARALADRGHEVMVVTTGVGVPAGDESEDGYGVFRLPALQLPPLRIAFDYRLNVALSPANVRRLAARLDRFDPDVVNVQSQVFDLSLQAEAWAIARRCPVVATIHTALVHSNRLFAAVLAAIDGALVRPALRWTRAHVVAPDQNMREYVDRRYRVPAERVADIPIGIDVTRFAGAAPMSDVRERHGIGGRPLVLSLGHVIPMLRDRLTLVEALPHLRELVPDVRVLVVGDVYDERFLRRARELGVRDLLLCVGSVAKEEVPAYVAAADVETHDLDGWGLGTASLEVMAAGVPIVASVRSDIFPGIELRDREPILLAPRAKPLMLAKTLAEVLGDPRLRRELGRRQAAFAREHFSIQSVAQKYEALFTRIISGGRRHPSPSVERE